MTNGLTKGLAKGSGTPMTILYKENTKTWDTCI